MKDRLQKRLDELKVEFESGQRALADLEAKQAGLRETLLRISGAVQVLEEELGGTEEPASDDGPSGDAESATSGGGAAKAKAKPEATEGGRRVSVLRRQEGAPVLLG